MRLPERRMLVFDQTPNSAGGPRKKMSSSAANCIPCGNTSDASNLTAHTFMVV